MIDKIKKELLNIQDRKYQNFSSKLLPGINNVIGVRLPILRKMAKEIAKGDYVSFLSNNDDEFFELTMLEGMLIGNLKLEFDEVFTLVEKFIPKINSWSVCDSFCSTLKIINKNKDKTKKFLSNYFCSNKEYDLRFAYVILLNYFAKDDYNYVIEKLSSFDNDAYYAKMAAAWCLSVCAVFHYDAFCVDIKSLNISPWVLNKGIQKALESYRLDKAQKQKLKLMKVNNF